jgi:hypothetical protein|tara:strand:- start:59 stop:388 length:330 start_codon:yes stop_codon:yes gene_type:complete
MAQLYYQVIAYLEANGKTKDDFSKVGLVNNLDGAGDIIETWNVDGLAQPTEEQLTSLDAQATTDYNNFKVDKTRKRSYGDWREQLDEIYHDIDAWKARLLSIKNSNPKS